MLVGESRDEYRPTLRSRHTIDDSDSDMATIIDQAISSRTQ